MPNYFSRTTLFLSFALLPSLPVNAQSLTTLLSFKNVNGAIPNGGLIADSSGNLYGTTAGGGAFTWGTVFKLTPPSGQKTAWKQTVLFSFNQTDGAGPWSNLIADKAGNLYGTTTGGGPLDLGTVFELTPPSGKGKDWTETVLLSFNGSNGAVPYSGLLADTAGNLYGTTSAGGAANSGTVFELSPTTPGQTVWSETVLFSFNEEPDSLNPGYTPIGGLIADSAGNLYGTTIWGGAYTSPGNSGAGTVFELTPPSGGQATWTENVLASFDVLGRLGYGAQPFGNLILDQGGNLYGATAGGGVVVVGSTGGVIFELTPPSAGQSAWTETVLAAFNGSNGSWPRAALMADSAGNLYSTTSQGGDPSKVCGSVGCGAVIKLSPPAIGQSTWTETVLAFFNGKDGAMPLGGLIADSAGVIYGTTSTGGAKSCSEIGINEGCGTVFKLTP